MAFKTQMRLAQISGSFGNADGKIRDDLAPEGTLGTIVATDLSGSLSVLASAVKRINGGAAFSAVDPSTLKDGAGNNRITYVDGAGLVINQENGAAAALTIGSATATDKLATFGGNIKIPDAGQIGNTSVADVMTLANSGIVTFKDDIIIKDGGTIGAASATSAITIASSGIVTLVDDLVIKDGGTIGNASVADVMTLANTGIVTFKDDIIIPDGKTIGSATTPAAMTVASDGVVAFADDIKIKDGGTIGSATTVDALTLATNGDLTLKEDLVFADGKLLGSDTTKDMLTINANDITMKAGKTLIVQGDLQVNGTTATLDVTNLNVEDPFVLLGDGAQTANSNSGVVFVSGSNVGARPDVVFARKANDLWGLGSIASNSGSITDATSMTHDIGLRLKDLELETNNDRIGVVGTHLTVTAAQDLILDANANLELDSNAGLFLFKDNGTQGLKIDIVDTAGDAVFKDAGDAEVFRIVGADNDLRMAGTQEIQFNDNKVSVRKGGTDQLVLRSNAVDFTLPSAQSAGDQVMIFDASGNASFTALSAGADSRNNNISVSVPETLVSGTLLSEVDGTLNFKHTGISDTSLNNACMVFVNGQLLLSGSDSKVGTSGADYALFEDGTVATGTITFDGTTGDVEANYVNSGTEATFELTVPLSVSQFTQVQHAGGNNVSKASAISANVNAIEMANNPTGLNVGDLVSYVTSTGVREIRRVTGTSGLNIQVAPNTGGAISAGSVISIAGLRTQFEFNVADGIESTGTISGGKIQIGIKNGSSGTNLNPALGSAGAAEAVAQQVVNAITQGNHDAARNLSATLDGLVVSVAPLGFFGSGLNGVATVSNIANTSNNPFAQANFANGADVGAKSLKFGFDLEADDVIQIVIR